MSGLLIFQKMKEDRCIYFLYSLLQFVFTSRFKYSTVRNKLFLKSKFQMNKDIVLDFCAPLTLPVNFEILGMFMCVP